MRISDWSSDVCSSDLEDVIVVLLVSHFPLRRAPAEAGAQGNQRRGLRLWALLSQERGALQNNVGYKSFHCGLSLSINSIFQARFHFFICNSRYRALSRSSRSEEHTSELQSLMRISYAVFCLNKNKNNR